MRHADRASRGRLLDVAHRGVVAPRVGATHPVGKAAEVHNALERGEITGKVVLTTP